MVGDMELGAMDVAVANSGVGTRMLKTVLVTPDGTIATSGKASPAGCAGACGP